MNRGQSTLWHRLLYSFSMFYPIARFARFPGLIRVQDHVVRPGTQRLGIFAGLRWGSLEVAAPFWGCRWTVDMLSRACESRA